MAGLARSVPIAGSAAAVLRDIEEAFAGVPPGRITIHEAEAIDLRAPADERAAERRRDPEQDWLEVPDASIGECQDALAFLDPAGWRFYIPAYMRWSIRHLGDGGSSMVPDHTIYSLALSPDAGLRAHQLERFRTLDVRQSRAVCRFLRLMAATEEVDCLVAGEALASHWARFCSERASGQEETPCR
jgi:uncharacterized protein DUF6714